ncbi:phosphatase PAP2 family protein [Paeniglutamicibacter cryotolerans]
MANRHRGLRSTRPSLALSRSWFGFCAGLGIVFCGVYALFVLSRKGQRIDDAALVSALHFMNANAIRQPAMDFMNAMPAVCAVIAVLALILAFVRGRLVAPPAIAAMSFAAAVLSTQVLKHGILVRPNHGISEATMNSFPSGHTTTAASALFTVLLLTPPAFRTWVSVVGGGFAAIAGAATLLLGWHRPSDVLAAYLVAAFWAVLGAAGLAIWSARPGNCHALSLTTHERIGFVPRLLFALGVLGTCIGSTLWLLVSASGSVAANQSRYLLVLSATLLLILSLAMVLTVGMQWILAHYRVDAAGHRGRDLGMK